MPTAARLARMLRLRTQLRKLRQHELDTLVARADALAATRRALDEARTRRAADEIRAAAGGVLTPATLQLGRRWDAVLAEQEQRCTVEASQVEAALARKRTELQEERREERKFESLVETQRLRAREGEAHAEDVMLDEHAIMRHGRIRPRSDT